MKSIFSFPISIFCFLVSAL
jgi:hypothetical protein